MKYFYNALFTIFLFPLFSVAQTNYKPGYVVNLKGDTLRGFIDYRAWRKNPKDIRFKETQDAAKAETFSVKDIGAFNITGFEYYQRAVIKASQDQTDLAHLVQKADIVYVTDTVFLQVSNKGSHFTLYNYTDNIKSRFYITETGDTEPRELVYHAFYLPGDVDAVQYDHGYRDQLENLAEKYVNDNSPLKAQIARANYEKSDLTKIARAINGTSMNQFSPKDVSGFRFFVGLEGDNSTFKISGAAALVTGQSSSFSPKIKAGIDVYGDKNIQSVILRVEVGYITNQYSLANNETQSPNSLLKFKQSITSLAPHLMVNVVNSDRVKVFIVGAALLNFASYSSNPFTVNGSLVPFNFPDLRTFWISFPIKASVEFNKKLGIEIGYVLPAPMTNNDNYSGNVTIYSAGINYFFGGK